MASLFPREEHAEALFHRILSNPGAEQQLYETFCMEQENASFEDGGGAECSFAKALLQAYENRDISALTIALCNNTMFDLLRTAYLIPYRFHGKNGGNPRLLTDANGEVREEYRNAVSARELRKFHDIYRQHLSVPRAALYLADGSHLRHKYTKDMQVREMYSPSRRGVLTLYALPDTVEQGLTEAQAYNIVWDAFNEIQQRCRPRWYSTVRTLATSCRKATMNWAFCCRLRSLNITSCTISSRWTALCCAVARK